MRVADAQATIQHYVEKFKMADFLNDDLLAQLQLFQFPIYANIFMEQDEQHYLYFLVEGTLQCSHYHLNGKLVVFALSNPFSAIGDLEILDDELLNSNVIATEKSTLLGIERRIVQQYGANDPRFLRFLNRQLKEKLYKSNSLQTSHILPVINRLALYILAQRKSDADSAVTLPSKDDLASLLSTTPRHLNRVLRELVATGAIAEGYPRIHIRDISLLCEIAQ